MRNGISTSGDSRLSMRSFHIERPEDRLRWPCWRLCTVSLPPPTPITTQLPSLSVYISTNWKSPLGEIGESAARGGGISSARPKVNTVPWRLASSTTTPAERRR
ncbi:MAG: hypothetical protein IPO67_11815 [Deltaproteobacteria bacterium]|nr:hypothetical protein [Deltaproteobacteria bacterium]